MATGGIVLLHGHGRTGRSMRAIGSALRRVGYRTIAPSYGWHGRSMTEIVDHLVPIIRSFDTGGPIHFVTHSLGGLVVRSLLTAYRPDQLGRVVMLAPPNAGSGLADLLFRLRLAGLVLGPVGTHLRTDRTREDELMLGTVDYEVGVIAGDRPIDPVLPRLLLRAPNDGKVTVLSTRLEGMSDHIVLPASHTFMVSNRRVVAQVRAYLANGRFDRPG